MQPLAAMLDHDDAFDERLPPEIQAKSWLHFTPLAIARQAARLLAPRAGTRVLDVGAGPGKFCLAAAAEVPHARFTGVEQRRHLVHLARAFGAELGLANARFIHADAFSLEWEQFDAFYIYNPFAEQLYAGECEIDRTISLAPSNFLLYVTAVHERLARARAGTRVVTYHGFGAPLPRGYELVAQGPDYDRLELWVKVATVGRELANAAVP